MIHTNRPKWNINSFNALEKYYKILSNVFEIHTAFAIATQCMAFITKKKLDLKQHLIQY